jgi:hypothetical protein
MDMRTDLNGAACPATLGEYRDTVAVKAPASAAVPFLEAAIAAAPNGRDEVVVEAHEAYMELLQPMIIKLPGEEIVPIPPQPQPPAEDPVPEYVEQPIWGTTRYDDP